MTKGRATGAGVKNSAITAPEGYIVAGHGRLVREAVRVNPNGGFFSTKANAIFVPTPRSKCIGGRREILLQNILVSPRQRDVFLYVKHFWRRFGYSPSYLDISSGLGLKTTRSIVDIVGRLVKMGLLHHTKGGKRDIVPMNRIGQQPNFYKLVNGRDDQFPNPGVKKLSE